MADTEVKKTLDLRLAKGEITIAEYKEMLYTIAKNEVISSKDEKPNFQRSNLETERLQPTFNKTFTNSIGMNFVKIPEGTFMMGSHDNDSDRYSDETQHQVTISRSFYMQTTQTTQEQWKRVMGKNPSRLTNWFIIKEDEYPVTNVSWNNVQSFIQKLNSVEGVKKYRLPTEAEWEYACRAGTKTKYYTGNTEKDLLRAGWQKLFTNAEYHKVAKKIPNAWGLYDMHGNVWEWVNDWYGDYPTENVTDPQGPSSGTIRVRRGGGLHSVPLECRSASRGATFQTLPLIKTPLDKYLNGPDAANDSTGFRLAMTI